MQVKQEIIIKVTNVNPKEIHIPLPDEESIKVLTLKRKVELICNLPMEEFDLYIGNDKLPLDRLIAQLPKQEVRIQLKNEAAPTHSKLLISLGVISLGVMLLGWKILKHR